MNSPIIETYPIYDGLEDIISETRAWYSALGLRMGGSLYSVIKASEGITGLVHSIAKTLGWNNISKKVRIVVEEMPSIAYITPGASQTIVHVGSWLYSRDKMEKWHPRISSMSENEMLVLTLGLINGAVALDMIAKATEELREATIRKALDALNNAYDRGYDQVYAVDVERMPWPDADVDERYIYIASAIHDILAMKACLTEFRDANWIVFPVLLFREFFDGDFAYHFRDEIKKDDTIDNLVGCVSALRCFSTHSASILDVESSVGINIIKAMLASTIESIQDNSNMAMSAISEEMLNAYIEEITSFDPKEKSQSESGDEGDESSNGNDSQSGKDSESDNDKQKSDKQSRQESGMINNIEPKDSSTPVNEDIAKSPVKSDEQFKTTGYDGRSTDDLDHSRIREQHSLSDNKKERDGKSKSSSWLEDFMRLAFSGKIKFNNDCGNMPLPRSFKSVDEYMGALEEQVGKDGIDSWRSHYHYLRFGENMLDVYNSIDKASLKNLFMERTMDIERSQPARSGIALIPTRIVNMFTDEKIFSPLPDAETERDSEVILLIDASGSMVSKQVRFTTGDKGRISVPLHAGVTGAAYAIAEGLQRANVNCSVFAHTTLPNDDCVFVCKITDHYSLNRKNEFLSSGGIICQNNGDGYAIEEVARFFSQDGRDIGRTLIVLSDGAPSFDFYNSWSEGREHTKKAADKLREEGIAVYSISLTSGVVGSNDFIYGKKNNFFPVDELDDGTVSLSPMLKRIVDIVSKDSVRSANNVLTQG